MIAPADTCLAILAAGQSTRFGAEDKLTAMLAGRMLGLHASATLSGMGWKWAVVVAARADHPCVPEWQAQGYDILPNPDAAQGLSTSVRLAAHAAQACGAGALLLCLADMPFVTIDHVRALLAVGDTGSVIASIHDGQPMPPALFGAAHFDRLTRLEGDSGARALLCAAVLVPMGKLLSIDVDDRDALLSLQP